MPPLNLYARVRFFLHNFAHETAGAARTRLSLRPLFSLRVAIDAKLGAIRAARCGRTPSRCLTIESENSHRVIARSACDEAISFVSAKLDCFAEPVIGRALRATRWLA